MAQSTPTPPTSPQSLTELAAEVDKYRQAYQVALARLQEAVKSSAPVPTIPDAQASKPSIAAMAVDIVRKNGRPMTVNDVFEELLRRGVPVRKTSLRATMYRLVDDKELKKVDTGEFSA